MHFSSFTQEVLLFTHVTGNPRRSGCPGLSSAVPLTLLSFSPCLLGQHTLRHVIPVWPGGCSNCRKERPLFPSAAKTPRLPLLGHSLVPGAPRGRKYSWLRHAGLQLCPAWTSPSACTHLKLRTSLSTTTGNYCSKAKKDLGREWDTNGQMSTAALSREGSPLEFPVHPVTQPN